MAGTAKIRGRLLRSDDDAGQDAGTSQHYENGLRLFDQGRYEDAVRSFEDALADPRKSGGPLTARLARFYLAEAHSALAVSQMSHHVPARAIAHLTEAIALTPHYADLHYHLGCAYLEQDEAGKAHEALSHALEINPSYARATLMRGIALYILGAYDDAFAQAETALTLDVSLDAQLLEGARVFHAQQESENALAMLKRLGAPDTDDARFHSRLALDYFKHGKLIEAEEEYRKALEVKPDYADLRNQYGVTLLALKRPTEAEREFTRAVEINPRYVEGHLNRGIALGQLGRTFEAHRAFQAVLEIDADNADALAHMDALAQGDTGDTGDTSEPVDISEAA